MTPTEAIIALQKTVISLQDVVLSLQQTVYAQGDAILTLSKMVDKKALDIVMPRLEKKEN